MYYEMWFLCHHNYTTDKISMYDTFTFNGIVSLFCLGTFTQSYLCIYGLTFLSVTPEHLFGYNHNL